MITLFTTAIARLRSGEQTPHQFFRRGKGYHYLLYLPKRYPSTKKLWPLLIFLHGAGERGNNLEKVKTHGPPLLIQKGKSFPFLALSPQCPSGQHWEADILQALLEEVIRKYRIDRSRIYLTGISMGGFGCWAWATRHPEMFAAIAPVCGGGDPARVCVLKDIPVWVFHGAKDRVVPLSRSRQMVRALEKCSGNVRFTVYPHAGHDSWTETYDNPELYRWFESKRTKVNGKVP
jgi:predicted peptidase